MLGFMYEGSRSRLFNTFQLPHATGLLVGIVIKDYTLRTSPISCTDHANKTQKQQAATQLAVYRRPPTSHQLDGAETTTELQPTHQLTTRLKCSTSRT